MILLQLLLNKLYSLALTPAHSLCSHLLHHWQSIASFSTSLIQVIQCTCLVFLPLFLGRLLSSGSLRFIVWFAIDISLQKNIKETTTALSSISTMYQPVDGVPATSCSVAMNAPSYSPIQSTPTTMLSISIWIMKGGGEIWLYKISPQHLNILYLNNLQRYCSI